MPPGLLTIQISLQVQSSRARVNQVPAGVRGSMVEGRLPILAVTTPGGQGRVPRETFLPLSLGHFLGFPPPPRNLAGNSSRELRSVSSGQSLQGASESLKKLQAPKSASSQPAAPFKRVELRSVIPGWSKQKQCALPRAAESPLLCPFPGAWQR